MIILLVLGMRKEEPEPVLPAAAYLNLNVFAMNPAVAIGLIRAAVQPEVVLKQKCIKSGIAEPVLIQSQDVFLIQVVEA